MTRNATQNSTNFEPDCRDSAPPNSGVVRHLARGALVAGGIVALSLTSIPTAARAGNAGVGAAIGLGILGGMVAGAAIASTVPPAYPAPSPYYYGPNGYYGTTPGYGYAPSQPYYGSPAAPYPQTNFEYYYSH
jgi:hypothetical protein